MILVDLIFFLLELCALAAFCYWGFHLKGAEHGVRVLTGIGSPVLIAVLWGTFIAPKASIPVSASVRFVLQLVVFGSAAAVLYVSGRHKLATLFLLVAIVELVLSHALNRQKAARL